ncbi:unnamed protein product [Cuscuta campestris]|uniref:Uncharacterized protein n=1 Tax=Cuscuta campestris TaxID=132261 RepID=A0A484KZV7_9ASTE|nr:unnamed protein product [Cuscuta campestris]
MANNNNPFNLRYVLEKEKLSGTNFLDWKMNLKIILECKKKLYFLTSEPPKAPRANARAVEITSYKKYEDDARDVRCVMLATMTPELQRLQKDMETHPMMTRLKVGPHVLKMIGHIETLEKLDAPLHPMLATDLILGSLPAEYSQTVVNLCINKLEMTMPELLKFLTTFEESLGKGKGKSVLMVEGSTVAKKSGPCSPAGTKRKGSKKPKPESNSSLLKPKEGAKKKSVVCYNCGKKGHWRRKPAPSSRSGLPLLVAEAERLTCLRKPLDGGPAVVAPRMTNPAGADLAANSAHHLRSFPSPSQSNLKVSSLFSVLMASSDSNPSTTAVDSAVVCFEEMYRQDPSLRPDGLMGGIDHSRVLSAVPLRTSVTVASSSRAPPLKKKKRSKVVKGKNPKSLPVTVLETGLITITGCLLLDIDFDEALRFVGNGYVVRRPHTTNHVFSVTCPDAKIGVHVASMRYGLRFPPHDLIVQFLNFYRLLPGQLSPHSYYCFSIFLIKCHQRGVPWSLDLFRYMFKVSKVGANEGNSYAVVSSQAEFGMAVFPSSLKLWKAKFVFISGFPGDRHPFHARFPECHTFIRHPRPATTPEFQAYAQKLLEDCRPKPPHMYTVCTEQNLAEVGILISLECQFELSEAVLGSRLKHGLEESAPRLEDIESEDNEREDGGEVGNDEESWQPSCSEGVAGMKPSGDLSLISRFFLLDAKSFNYCFVLAGDMNPVDVIRKAKLLARNRGRGAEVQQGSPPVGATRSVASARTQEATPARNQRKRKLIQVEDEETASEQDVVLTQSPTSKRPGYLHGGKSPASFDKANGVVQAEVEATSLSAALKDEDEILSSLQGLMDNFHKQVSAKLSLITEHRAGAEFSSSMNFLASVETELSRLRKLAEIEHERATELEMQAVAKSEEVVRLQGLLKESEESASQLTASMAELEGRLRQSEGRISELDLELAEVVSAQRLVESPSFKENYLERMAAYYEDWLKTEAGTEKMGVEGTKWFESGVYHGIQLVLRRARRVDPSFPPPGVVIPEMHDPSLNAELGENPDHLGTPSTRMRAQMESATSNPQMPFLSVFLGTSFIRAIPPCSFLMADSSLPSFATALTAVGKCTHPDLPSLSEDSVQSPFRQEPDPTEVAQKSGRLVRKVGTNVRAYLKGFRRAHRKKTISADLKAHLAVDHGASSVDSSFSEEINVYFDHSGNNA